MILKRYQYGGIEIINTGNHVYKGHSKEPEHVAIMNSCRLLNILRLKIICIIH